MHDKNPFDAYPRNHEDLDSLRNSIRDLIRDLADKQDIPKDDTTPLPSMSIVYGASAPMSAPNDAPDMIPVDDRNDGPDYDIPSMSELYAPPDILEQARAAQRDAQRPATSQVYAPADIPPRQPEKSARRTPDDDDEPPMRMVYAPPRFVADKKNEGSDND